MNLLDSVCKIDSLNLFTNSCNNMFTRINNNYTTNYNNTINKGGFLIIVASKDDLPKVLVDAIKSQEESNPTPEQIPAESTENE